MFYRILVTFSNSKNYTNYTKLMYKFVYYYIKNRVYF